MTEPASNTLNRVRRFPRHYSRSEAARILGVSVCTVDRERERGNLGFTMIGCSVRITEDQLAEYFENRKVEPCAAVKQTSPAKSENTGYQNDQIARPGAGPGSMPRLGKRGVRHLKQTILTRPKSASRNG